ncbi:MAG: 3-octaprenyl-4-hydroxybenzoate carboxy-lyase [Promethearchaeota archaeon CR_4]|nr:MAG: 3-octaprenyl-4-hydroxybenzoate carboxy-lyase [Candidatus Lokiarchaeota archaeon CR_4]
MRIVVGVTGASGVILASKLLQILKEKQVETHLIVSDIAKKVADLEHVSFNADLEYAIRDFTANLASGSFFTSGMVVIPCSMNSLAKIASGVEDNLILRAAAIHLKEGRKLVIVPRETPLNEIQIRNLLKVKRAGAHILLPVLTFYHEPKTIDDMIGFVLGKLLDLLGIENTLYKRWSERDLS